MGFQVKLENKDDLEIQVWLDDVVPMENQVYLEFLEKLELMAGLDHLDLPAPRVQQAHLASQVLKALRDR